MSHKILHILGIPPQIRQLSEIKKTHDFVERVDTNINLFREQLETNTDRVIERVEATIHTSVTEALENHERSLGQITPLAVQQNSLNVIKNYLDDCGFDEVLESIRSRREGDNVESLQNQHSVGGRGRSQILRYCEETGLPPT